MASRSSAAAHDPARVLVEEVLRTGLTLTNVVSGLLEDLPEDAFPGAHPAEVLIEMVSGSIRPAVEAAGDDVVQAATALLGAVLDRTIADLRTATRLAEERAKPRA